MSQVPNSYPQSRGIELDYENRVDSMFLVRFFNSVYAWMATALALTALVAYSVSQMPEVMRFLNLNRFVVVALCLGAWGIAWAVQKTAMSISATAGTALFMLYAAVIGLLVSYIFIVYPISTIAGAFLMTAGTFAVMSVYGFLTKRNLSGIGSILVMAGIGLILASLVNVFLASNALSWVLTYAILAVFIGLTAYYTQMLKEFALSNARDNPELAARFAIVGSLLLYISFINMFLSILRILGNKR